VTLTTKLTTVFSALLMMLVLFIAASTAVLTPLISSLAPATPGTTWAPAPNDAALADIPANYLAYYEQAATACAGLNWSILAAIGKIESDHGRSTLPGVAPGTENAAGAGGPMQQLQPTWNAITSRHRIPPGGATPPSRYNPHDAIWAAAYLLCDDGVARGDLRAAIFAYNHADWYVNQVLDQARRYQQAAQPTTSTPGPAQQNPPTGSTPSAFAVAFARSQIGQPYLWGGSADGGFDCSGLTTAAYRAAGITLPRTAQTQYNAGPRLPPGATAQAGDLLFFGTGPEHVTHVGIATSATTMIDAPDFGTTVRQDRIQRNLVGITRPNQTQ
jgi:cell wall-associated NlpC family hydrolase